HLVQHPRVGAGLAAERRQAGQGGAQGRGQPGRGHGEEDQARAAGHSWSFLTLARLSSTISGTAIAPTTICDSATSPDCSDRYRKASASPKNPAVNAWRNGSLGKR